MKSYQANIEICSLSLRETILFINLSHSTQYIKSKFLIIASQTSVSPYTQTHARLHIHPKCRPGPHTHAKCDDTFD